MNIAPSVPTPVVDVRKPAATPWLDISVRQIARQWAFETIMPRGDKDAYTEKQKRKADHIAEGYEDRGVSEDEAERRAWATVNKQDGGGKKSGSGRKSKS